MSSPPRCKSIKRLGTPERCDQVAEHDGEHSAVGQHWTGTRLRCPDNGHCHHGCLTGCFRVKYAGPLSGVYSGVDVWPNQVIREYGEPTGCVL